MADAVSADYITQYLLDAAGRGLMHAAEHVAALARTKAPVRRIFAVGRGEGRRSHSVDVVLPSKFNKRQGPVTISIAESTGGGSPWKVRAGREIVSGDYGIGVASSKMIRGRVNSLAPVVNSPIGLIGGEALRAWSGKPGSGFLSVTKIRKPTGGSFALSSLLTSRGRYEVSSGRAVHEGLVGGKLRASIHASGPIEEGYRISALVSAEAHDKGRTHNYARDQEFGSRHNRKHPFLRPALLESKDYLFKALKREMESGQRPRNDSHGESVPVLLHLNVRVRGVEAVNAEIDRMLEGLG